MLAHRLLNDTRQGVVNECYVIIAEGTTVHTEGRGLGALRYPLPYPQFLIAQLHAQMGSSSRPPI